MFCRALFFIGAGGFCLSTIKCCLSDIPLSKRKNKIVKRNRIYTFYEIQLCLCRLFQLVILLVVLYILQDSNMHLCSH